MSGDLTFWEKASSLKASQECGTPEIILNFWLFLMALPELHTKAARWPSDPFASPNLVNSFKSHSSITKPAGVLTPFIPIHFPARAFGGRIFHSVDASCQTDADLVYSSYTRVNVGSQC